MGTKMKGLLKGLRYISQIFEDEDKEPEMQIGLPTDVKHVAHIGWNGPTVDPPSWMKDFKEPPADQSAPPGVVVSGESREKPETQGSRSRAVKLQNSASKGVKDLTRSRDLLLEEGSSTSCPLQVQEETSTAKPKRNSSSASSTSKLTRKLKDPVAGSDLPSRSLPEVPKKLRRKKKAKEESSNSVSSRTKVGGAPSAGSMYSDPGPDTEQVAGPNSSQFAHSWRQ